MFAKAVTLLVLSSGALAASVPRQLAGAINSPLPPLPSNEPITDTCDFVQAGALDALVADGNGATTSFVNTCLCISTVPAFIVANAGAAAVAAQVGVPAVTTALDQIILNDPTRVTCTFPAFSIPACIDNDPCSYTCLPGYENQDGDCVPGSAPPTSCPGNYGLNNTSCVCPQPNCYFNGDCLPPA